MHLPLAEGEKDESADSGPGQLHVIQSDEYTLFTELSRPMPDYALEHVFAQHGPIEWVSGALPLLFCGELPFILLHSHRCSHRVSCS